MVRYEIVPDALYSPLFSVNPTSGALTLTQALSTRPANEIRVSFCIHLNFTNHTHSSYCFCWPSLLCAAEICFWQTEVYFIKFHGGIYLLTNGKHRKIVPLVSAAEIFGKRRLTNHCSQMTFFTGVNSFASKNINVCVQARCCRGGWRRWYFLCGCRKQRRYYISFSRNSLQAATKLVSLRNNVLNKITVHQSLDFTWNNRARAS